MVVCSRARHTREWHLRAHVLKLCPGTGPARPYHGSSAEPGRCVPWKFIVCSDHPFVTVVFSSPIPSWSTACLRCTKPHLSPLFPRILDWTLSVELPPQSKESRQKEWGDPSPSMSCHNGCCCVVRYINSVVNLDRFVAK